MTADVATFDRHRRLLFTVAYQMLGSVADAEDAVQDAWLRWSAADRTDVDDPKAYLVRIVSRLALDRLGAAHTRRETYVGPWLPEPLVTDSAPDPGEAAEVAEQVSLALLVVLETLSPLERAVFVLREAFGFPYAEIATTLEKSEAAVRQLAGRARKHVDERKHRFDVDPAECRDLTERFLSAASGGDLEGLLSILAPDVRLVGDSGGKTKAPLRVMQSADKVGRFVVAISQQPVPDAEVRFVEANGAPAILILSGGKPDTVMQMEVLDGRIQCVYIVRNPDKLAAFAGPDKD
jgi:RNA polymerase sigma-70 factor, ECF subfamily